MDAELRQITCMCSQWKHFGRTLLGCTGIIPIDQDRFPVLVAPVFMCFVVTAVFVYLMYVAHSEEKNLVLKALAILTESAAEKMAAEIEQQGSNADGIS